MQLHIETVVTVRCDTCACLPSLWDLESLKYRAHQFCGTKLAVELFMSNHPLLIRIVMFTFQGTPPDFKKRTIILMTSLFLTYLIFSHSFLKHSLLVLFCPHFNSSISVSVSRDFTSNIKCKSIQKLKKYLEIEGREMYSWER